MGCGGDVGGDGGWVLVDLTCWRVSIRWTLIPRMDLGGVLAHQAGCETLKGDEGTCVYVFVPCINDGTKTGPVKEM